MLQRSSCKTSENKTMVEDEVDESWAWPVRWGKKKAPTAAENTRKCRKGFFFGLLVRSEERKFYRIFFLKYFRDKLLQAVTWKKNFFTPFSCYKHRSHHKFLVGLCRSWRWESCWWRNGEPPRMFFRVFTLRSTLRNMNLLLAIRVSCLGWKIFGFLIIFVYVWMLISNFSFYFRSLFHEGSSWVYHPPIFQTEEKKHFHKVPSGTDI